jgi:kynureninase
VGVTGRDSAAEADARDPLRDFRARFALGDPDRIYLEGNSLGMLPLATRNRLAAAVDEWAERGVSGWPDWIEHPTTVGDLLGTELLGAAPGEVLVCDSTTVNLFKLCGAILDAEDAPAAVVTDRTNFPTDRYVLEGLCEQRGVELRLFDSDPIEGPRPEDLSGVLAETDPALVALSHVSYRSGAVLPIGAIEELVRAHGATVVWDLSHSVGALPIDLPGSAARFAVGCTYKYLNAGPGSPAWLYVAAAEQERLRSPIQGWFGQRAQFEMDRHYEPAAGIGRFLTGTPSIHGLAAVEEGVRLLAEAGIEALRAKSVELTGLAIELHRAWLEPLGFELLSPADAARRGSHVCLGHPEAWPIRCALAERANVIVDFRGPDAIRLGVAPLYTRHVDVWDAVDRIRRLVEAAEHRAFADEPPGRVT